ncbi:LysR substrate-binding domain-containing protein [Curtobacterium sp. PhB136]|uniref:LysR family transcriptional regulator n=1 Tax=Curtobacterium sp. PhB136 TaxID=2485181 RepID=UPI001048F9CE|nr:LysR substrate-binding domain-containing protein [Curtobacterium sp. PhB136]TCK62935.1 DNA-binding transcriptional LysR family regulator [Curtobacterium sp. PhB136]
MSDLDPQLLRVLRAVADAGSITGAAAALGYSQPAVSQLLQRAEQRLGHTLVLRGARGVTLTEAGVVLADHALHVHAALTAAREDLDAIGGLTRGRVRIAGFPSASSTLVPAVLASLAVSVPGLSTSYVEVEPPEALDLLRRGEVDVALTFTYVGDEVAAVPDPALVTRALGRDPLALVTPVAAVPSGGSVASGASGASVASVASGASVASVASVRPGGPDHVRAAGPASSVAGTTVVDLASQRGARWIGGCPRCRGHLLASCATAGFTPDIVLETDNAAAVVGLVAAGLGVALLPRLALATTVIPAGVSIDPVDEDLARRVEVVVARGAERVPSVRATLDAVRAAAALLA